MKPPKMLQNPKELERFIEILKREKVRSYLEIGSKFGGSLWPIANALPKGSLIVSVDLPWGKQESKPILQDCATELTKLGYEMHLLFGDSTDKSIITVVESLGPFDACLIDANHTLPYVTKDWETYGPMCKIVTFHDIGWKTRPGVLDRLPGKMPIDVPILWNSIKDKYRYVEINLEPRDNGFGVLWRT